MAAAVLAAAGSTPLSAQSVDIIRGRVVGPDSTGIQGVLVTATTLDGNVNRTRRTDATGRYTISFPGGEGDYWVSFQALGFAMRRYQVKRTADQEILIADARLEPSAQALALIQTVASNPVARNDTISDVSGTERTVAANELNLLTPDQMGDLAAMVSSIPGVQLLPGADGASDAFSVFGLGGDQNNTQLNGLLFGDASVPRDAGLSTSLSTSPYDVSRGGFSGGQVQIRTSSGSNFIRQNLSGTLITPQTQFLDRAGIAAGQQYTNMSLGGGASGPIKPDELFYNTSFQLDRRMNDLQTLLNTSDLGFETIGVASDSVSRLLDILSAQQLPLAIRAGIDQRLNDRGSFLAGFNYTQPNSERGNTYSLTFTGNMNRSAPVASGGGFGGGQGALNTPSRFGTTLSWGGGAQFAARGELGFKGIFTESNIGYSTSRSGGTPYAVLPSGVVRVSSALGDGTTTVNNLGFGGAPGLNASSMNQTVSGLNTLSYFSSDNKHRVKFTTEFRYDQYSQDQNNNELGTFTFNNLADLSAGRPSQYTRQLSPRRRDGSQLVGAFSLGDAWRPTRDVQIQYGVRVDGNKYLYGPQANPLVSEVFGANNTDVPSRLYVSPRIGFSWTYGTAQQLALAPGMVQAPRAVIRGGVGVFQNTPGVQLIGSAIDNTGLPSGILTLTCIGAAAPTANWGQYIVDQAAIPTTCADGSSGSVFANSTPAITVFNPDYAAQRSLRGNLQWSGAILGNRFSSTVDLTVSRNQNQANNIDLNFPGELGFTLADEGGRPVYVPTSVIVPSTGQIGWRDSRVDSRFGRVTQNRSDITSDSKQLQVSLRPLALNTLYSWNLSYVLSDVKEQFQGFNSTIGNPLDIQRSRGNFARHQLQVSGNLNLFNTVRINVGTNFRSGTPYTPVISGDVNGDSYGNDRAFIFDPAAASDPVVAQGIQSLLDNGTKQTRDCLRAQLGQLAARNSCTGPWTVQANMGVSFNSLKIGLPQRAVLSFNIQNPLGGLDRIINGENVKGWGQTINPPQNLLFVRGFDPVTQAFKYEVNQRFGSTRVAQTTNRSPTIITASLRYDLGPTRERQQLLQQLDRGRTRPGNKPNVQQIRGTANSGLINPMQQILANADTLKLTRKQADSIVAMNRRYVLRSDSIWNPVARELAELPDEYSHGMAYDKYRVAREQTVDMLIRVAPALKALLTPAQFRILPTQTAGYLDKRTLESIRSGTAGGGGGGMGGGGRGR
ncbi:MAG: TonB-dependent receptor [Gemmatimonadota bacterium]